MPNALKIIKEISINIEIKIWKSDNIFFSNNTHIASQQQQHGPGSSLCSLSYHKNFASFLYWNEYDI